MSELSKRVIVAVIGIPVALGLIYVGSYYFSLAIFIITILGVSEFISIAKSKTDKINSVPTYIFTAIVPVIFTFTFMPDILAFYLILLILIAFLTIYTIQIFKGVNGAIFSVSASLNTIFYLGFGFSSLIIIRNFNKYLLYWRDVFGQKSFLYSSEFADSATWGMFLFFIFGSIWICDSAAYFVGKSIGKHKLHPQVSPKKSWEGAIAGFASAVFAFTLLNYFFINSIPVYFSISGGIVIGIFGQIGDLAESQLKRDAGVKDSSDLLPGHGGILDRFDSALFAFPLMVILLFVYAFFG